MKKKIQEILLEFRYHKRVMGFLGFTDKMKYLYFQVYERECRKRPDCFGQAALRHLGTDYLDGINNVAFHCESCHKRAMGVIEEFHRNYVPMAEEPIIQEEVTEHVETVEEVLPEKTGDHRPFTKKPERRSLKSR